MLAFFVMVFLIVVVFLMVVLVMVVHVVTLFVMMREFQRVSGVVTIKLRCFVFILSKVHGFHCTGQAFAKLVHKDGLVIQGGLT